ncbi:MAG: hypothetical protein NT070_02460 [Cyanobacteria bacterium]|nr:hypothetical protein [Cyanobacteriota bacterium]
MQDLRRRSHSKNNRSPQFLAAISDSLGCSEAEVLQLFENCNACFAETLTSSPQPQILGAIGWEAGGAMTYGRS